MQFFERVKKSIRPTSLKVGSFVVSPTFSKGSRDTFLDQRTYNPIELDLRSEKLRDPMDQILDLSWEEQTVSHGVWSTVRGASQGWYIELRNPDGSYVDGESELKELLKVIISKHTYTDKEDKFEFSLSFDALRNQMYRSVKLWGAVAAEAVVTKTRDPGYIKLIDPNTIKFKEPKPFNYVPHQETNEGGEISLDRPNFFWSRLDPELAGPYARSPIYPVLETVYFFREFVRALKEVVDKTAWPRITVEIMEDVLMQSLPDEIRNAGTDRITEWIDLQKQAVAKTIQQLKPGDAFIFGSYIKAGILESQGQSRGTLNPEPLLKVLERHLAQSMKTFASVLGVEGEIDPLQNFMEHLSLRGYQQPVEELMSNALTFFLRVMGKDILAYFRHSPFELRPESELEPARSQKMATNTKLLHMGAMTPEEFSLSMTGTSMPEDSILPDLYNREDLLDTANNAPDASDTDTSKSPAKPSDDSDGRSKPGASTKRGQKPSAKKTGEIKRTPRGTSRKPRRK